MSDRKFWLFISLAVSTAGLATAACAGLIGIDTLPPLPDAGADAQPPNSSKKDRESPDASDASDGAVDAATCSGRVVRDANGVFVRSGSTDSSTCGSRVTPCATIEKGIEQAKILSKSTVYVARGTYTEAITLEPGVTVEGAWDVLVTDWKPVCNATELGTVTVVAPASANATVTANASGPASGLHLLTVKSKPKAASGESLYGIFATGGADVVLDDVVIDVSDGGDGSGGKSGADGGAAEAGCVPGDGAAGAEGMNGPAATAGTFNPSGYQPSQGQVASAGQAGNAGDCSIYPSCITTCMVPLCGTGCPPSTTSGCGGQPGGGGAGGRGGGSSVAVFAWGAKLTIIGGSLRAGNGGSGGNGGLGGPGGPGGPSHASITGCLSFCMSVDGGTPMCASVGDTTAQTAAAGATGGMGGQGGGGAGGSSFAIVVGGDAGVTLDNAPLLAHGNAGMGGAVGGPSGKAGDQGP